MPYKAKHGHKIIRQQPQLRYCNRKIRYVNSDISKSSRYHVENMGERWRDPLFAASDCRSVFPFLLHTQNIDAKPTKNPMNFQTVLKPHSEVSLDNWYISLSKWSVLEPGEVSVFLVLFVAGLYNGMINSLPLLMFLASSRGQWGEKNRRSSSRYF